MWIGVLLLAGIMGLTPVAVLAEQQDVQRSRVDLIERTNALEAAVRELQAKSEEEEEEVEMENPRIEGQLEFEEQYNIDDSGDSD